MRSLLLAVFMATLLASPSVKADGNCGILFTLEKFQTKMETLNPGLKFQEAWSFIRPKQAGYYYVDNPKTTPNRLATVVLLERGCVMLEIIAFKNVSRVITVAESTIE